MDGSLIEVRRGLHYDTSAILALDPIAERADGVRRAIEDGRCLVAVDTREGIVGFCVAAEFYGFDFLELLLVARPYRRRGVGTRLVNAWEQMARTAKLFTSTNESNEPMQRLCEGLGYSRSGVIENLEEGDPEIVYFRPNGRST